MTKLMRFHTVDANPHYYWENNSVAIKLRKGEITTYDQYKAACDSAGCHCYIEKVFDEHIREQAINNS